MSVSPVKIFTSTSLRKTTLPMVSRCSERVEDAEIQIMNISTSSFADNIIELKFMWTAEIERRVVCESGKHETCTRITVIT